MGTFKNIVVPVDFSETSDEAWRMACDIAATSGSRLHLLHVVPEPLQQSWAPGAMAVDFDALARDWMTEAEERLARIAPTRAIDPVRITRTVVVGVPHARILGFATAFRADLIVMGTHGYGPLRHLLLGNVAERVVRQAICPVLTVPHRSLGTPESRHEPAAASA